MNCLLIEFFDRQSAYTQLIWSNVQFVGCAAAQLVTIKFAAEKILKFAFAYSLDKGYVMACNYYPRGNLVGRPVNKLGESCTNCDDDRASCSRIFTGLCGLGK